MLLLLGQNLQWYTIELHIKKTDTKISPVTKLTVKSSPRDDGGHSPPRVGIRVINLNRFEVRRPIKASDCHQLPVYHSQAHLETQRNVTNGLMTFTLQPTANQTRCTRNASSPRSAWTSWPPQGTIGWSWDCSARRCSAPWCRLCHRPSRSCPGKRRSPGVSSVFPWETPCASGSLGDCSVPLRQEGSNKWRLADEGEGECDKESNRKQKAVIKLYIRVKQRHLVASFLFGSIFVFFFFWFIVAPW